MDARTLEITGVEALARWKHPTEGLLAPIHFLDIAEDIGVLQKIDQSILEQALADRQYWIDHRVEPLQVSVNVSFRRLNNPELLDAIACLRIPRGAISFELLESIFLDDADTATMENTNALKEAGIDIEIDDFGSGHASILSVIRLRPKRLKIDQNLIADSIKSKSQARIIKAIVDIGEALNVEVVAEGVETPEHVRLCRELGCDTLQGYAFAHPMDRDDFLKYALSHCLRERVW